MLRHEWARELAERQDAPLDFVEVYPENYMRRGRYHKKNLHALGERWALTAHGVHLSLGGTDALSGDYLCEAADFFAEFGIDRFGEHVGAAIHRGEVLHEIAPIALNAETLQRFADRCIAAAEQLGVAVMVENTCAYWLPPDSSMSEWAFLSGLCDRAPVGLLLDVNNLWVNSCNHGFDPYVALKAMPLDRVKEVHVGGFTVDAPTGLIIDTHAAAPSPPVWRLLIEALRRVGPVPVLLEWETQHGGLDRVLAELRSLQQAWQVACQEPSRESAPGKPRRKSAA